MIITLTLNPALDKTIEINDFQVNHVNRVSSIRLDPGGKGINVSKVVHSLGGKSKALGVLAGSTGKFIEDKLDILGIENEFIFTDGETRTNIKVVDKEKGTNTDINEKGPDIDIQVLEEIAYKIIDNTSIADILVFSGSVPGNVDSGIYYDLIESAKKKGIKTILDADGALLEKGIEAGPYLIKPNIHELERLYDRKITSPMEAIDLGKKFFEKGIEMVVISLGSEGAIFMTKEKTALVKGLKVDVISTVGAGDSMVGALALGIERDFDFEELIRLATATSAASVMTSGTEPGDMKVIEELSEKVVFSYL